MAAAAVNGIHPSHRHHHHHFHIQQSQHNGNHAAPVKQVSGTAEDGQGESKSPSGTLSVAASKEHVFDQFVTACTCKSILSSFSQLLDVTGLRHVEHSTFYPRLKAELRGSWRAQSLWARLDKRWAHREYKAGMACSNTKVLVIGAGPCGLRTAIECALLGAKTVVVEKRDRFSRNNVLHLWPFLITDLKGLGAKKFFGKFCAGAIDHISIRQLQCILMKVALLVGVEIHVNVSFDGLIEPPDDQTTGVGWRCQVTPEDHVLSEYIFDVLIGADGKRNTLPGFNRKEFRGKLAIAVTANFINRNTQAEARVEEISGVAFIFNQKFFLDLKESTRIDLENIVYYKDDTHYFVMTAKKASLLEKGVLKEDHADTIALLDRSNVDQQALMAYAREAADFSTNYKLPSLDYANNHYGQADVAMFDFTSMFAAENASRFIVKNGHHLLMTLVGDSLLEPFWPTGSGCARGFLGAFDTAWMIRSWAMGRSPLQVLAERESVYAVLSQTTPNYLHKNHNLYTIDPNSRYPNLNHKLIKPRQMLHLYEGGEVADEELEEDDTFTTAAPPKKPKNEISSIDSYTLLRWCQRVLNTGKYRDVHVVDLTCSWRSGLALCALIHSFRPELINNTLLLESDVVENNRMAFQVAEKELGIPPVMSAEDMAKHEIPDKLTMVSYLSQFYELFKHELLPSSMPLPVKAKRKSTSGKEAVATKQPKSPHSPNRRTSFLQKLSARLAKSKKRKEQEMNEASPLGSKKFKEKIEDSSVELLEYKKLPMEEIANRLQLDRGTDIKVNKAEERSGAVSVTAMADLLVAKFKSNQEQPPPEPIRRPKGQPSLLAASSASEFCTFCHKRVYLMERMSAEGAFFHRHCLKCDHCGVGLRLTNYSCDREAKPVKFYCYRHALPDMRLRPARKRGLEEEETKENVPEMVVTEAPDLNDNKGSRQKSPRKATANRSPITLPVDVPDKPTKTPERVEFEISFDGAEEESEEEQFEHNLRASLSSDALLDEESSSDSDSECFESGEEDAEVWENAVESLGLPPDRSGLPNSPLTLEKACEFVSNWRRHHSREDLATSDSEDVAPSHGKRDNSETRRRPKHHREKHGSSSGYTRLVRTDDDNEEEDEDDECDDDEDEEDEESSTEVEGDSEYETDSSSEDDEPTGSGPSKTSSHSIGTSKTPVSPVARLSASKANFFSAVPTPVSLDPFSMFGIGKKGQEEQEEQKTEEKETEPEEKKKTLSPDKKAEKGGEKGKKKKKPLKKIISTPDNETVLSLDNRMIPSPESRSVSEKARPGSISPKSTDISESLETDPKSPDLISQRVSHTGSLAELRLAFAADKWAEVDIEDDVETFESEEKPMEVETEGEPLWEERVQVQAEKFSTPNLNRLSSQSVPNVAQPKKPQSILKRPSFDLGTIKSEGLGVTLAPAETCSDDGDDERGDGEDDDDDDDMLEKTAVSKAMEQLLHDFDSKSQEPQAKADRQPKNETSDSGENEVFIEGRLSPSGLKTRKFRLKRQRRSSKGDNRRLSKSGTSDSEAARTDPTTTDNSQARSSMSRSPSVEVQLQVAEPESSMVSEIFEEPDKLTSVNEQAEEQPSPQMKEIISEEASAVKDEIAEMGTGLSEIAVETGDDTLRQVLENVAAMPDLSDNSDIDELVIANIDDKFVTNRRGGSKNKPKKLKVGKKKKKEADTNKTFEVVEEDHSSFSISTPSGSDSESVSSAVVDEFAGQTLDIVPGDDDIKPDADMMKDYTTTISLALGESYSDAEDIVEKDKPLDNKVGASSLKPVSSPLSENIENDISSSLCNSVNGERVANNDSTATGNSSVYQTPDSSVSEPVNRSTAEIKDKNNSNQGSSPKNNLAQAAPIPRPRKSLTSPPISPSVVTPVSPQPSSALNPRDSSGSDLFVSPAENLPQPSSPLSQISKSKPSSILNQAVTKDTVAQSMPGTTPKPVKPTSHTNGDPTSRKVTDAANPVKKVQRKLPELPKLNVLSRQPLQSAARQPPDQPIMCSSPKIATRQSKPAPAAENKAMCSRPLPIPKSSTSEPRKSESTSKKPPQPPTSSSSITKTPKTGKPTFSDAPSFTKPISKPVFKPPAKMKVPLDKAKLKLGSSSDKTESDVELDKKKKISADGIFIPKSPEDDIPFADESETDEQFYTPCAPEKKAQPRFLIKPENLLVHKRLLPNPPSMPSSAASSPGVLRADQIREIRQAEMEKAKLQARERARLKSDEELGLVGVSSPASTPTRGTLQQRQAQQTYLQPEQRGHQRNASYDTASTSDVLSDSDDSRLREVTPPAADNAPGTSNNTTATSPEKKSKKKKKPKNPKNRKMKKDDTKEADSEKKEKRRSLLSLILPAKSEKGGKEYSSGNSTPKGSDDNLVDEVAKTKKQNAKNRSLDKKAKTKSGFGRNDLEKTPTSEMNSKDLAICSVFHTQATTRPTRAGFDMDPAMRTVPLAPKASGDEFSDSDESHVSFSTMQKRRDEDIDERLARRLRKIQLKQQKQAQQKRLRMAQEIQRQLEEVEVRQRELESRGIAVEKALRGDGPEEDVDEGALMSEWFTLVHEKNALLRYESELNVRAKELELEDRQARLELDFRERSRLPESNKTEREIVAEGKLLDELLDVVEQRNNLVAMLEEDRVREQKEDRDLKDMMSQKGFTLSPLSFDTRRERQRIEAPLASMAL